MIMLQNYVQRPRGGFSQLNGYMLFQIRHKIWEFRLVRIGIYWKLNIVLYFRILTLSYDFEPVSFVENPVLLNLWLLFIDCARSVIQRRPELKGCED